jgi:ferrochelatase
VPKPFDAVVVIAFGGPQGPADIRPFLANVLKGRRVAPERVEEVAHHYELFDGVSPLTSLTNLQAVGLRDALAARGAPLPVYVGMRNWHPYLADTLAQMSRDGVRRAVGVIAAAHRSYSSCTQYRENLAEARRRLREDGLPDVEVTCVPDWHLSDGFVAANVANIRRALETLPEPVRARAEIVFTAHSIPVPMAQRYPYERQIHESADAIMAHVAGRTARGTGYSVVFQSRSGRPEDPWLGPDVCDYLRDASARGVPGVVLCPVGFICDHVEVLYDLDVEAAAVARELGLPLARASAVNDHPLFVDALAASVETVIRRYAAGRPLLLTAAS